MRRLALSLLEVTIALALFAVVLAAVLQSMVSVSGFSDQSARHGDLEAQSRLLLQRIGSDLENASWFSVYDPATKHMVHLFPKITKPADSANTYGDELNFLKLRTERHASDNPADLRGQHIDLDRTPAVPMSRFATASPVYSLVLNQDWTPNARNLPFIAETWESGGESTTFAGNRDLSKLREYRYVVRPDEAVTGRGVLLREYRNGDRQPWLVDEVVGEDIVSIEFSTFDQTTYLDPDQIRVAVNLQADGAAGQARAIRRFEMTIAMRSVNDDN